MKKDAYHFPHFCNARHDRKIRRIRKELGLEGYGIFFMLLEVLREQTDFKFPLHDIDLLADDFGTSPQKVEIVIKKYDLFNLDKDGKFFSTKLLMYLQPYFEKSERARIAANTRWNNANALLGHSKCNASKVKESKVKNSNRGNFIPPLIDEIKDYCNSRKNSVDPQKWHDWYSAKGWMIGKNKMKDWKAAVRTWEEPQEKERDKL